MPDTICTTPPEAHCSTKNEMVQEDSPNTSQHKNNEEIRIVMDTSNYHEVVLSDAFVDKTLHLRSFFRQFTHNKEKNMKTFLIVGPNDCGKSTNMNMVKLFLEIDVDDEGNPKINVEKVNGKWEVLPENKQTKNFKLFKKLKIYNCQHDPVHSEEECTEGKCKHRNFFYENCSRHPVIYFDLAFVRSVSDGKLETYLQTALQGTYRMHPYLGDARSHLDEESKEKCYEYMYHKCLDEKKISSGLEFLGRCLNKQFQKGVFVLVEEFDAPIFHMLRKPITETEMVKVINRIGILFAGVLKSTGIVKVSGAMVNACLDITGTLSSYANNVTTCLFLEDDLFADYCGFTFDEVNKLLDKRVFRNVDKTVIECNSYKMLKSDTIVYNNCSVLKYLHDWVTLRNKHLENGLPIPHNNICEMCSFWGTRPILNFDELLAVPDIRKQFLRLTKDGFIIVNDRKNKLNPEELFLLQNILNYHNRKLTDKEIEVFFHYLRDRGYLYTTEKINGRIRLEIPNLKTSYELRKKLCAREFYEQHFKVEPANFLRTLQSLNRNNENAFENLVESLVEMFPSVKPTTHDELKGILFRFTFQGMWFHEFETVESKPLVVFGENFIPDLLVKREDGTGIILEIASDGKDEREVLDEIFEKKYYTRLTGNLHQKIYIGLCYDYATGNAKLCAHVTDGRVAKNLSEEDEQKLIFYDAKEILKNVQ